LVFADVASIAWRYRLHGAAFRRFPDAPVSARRQRL